LYICWCWNWVLVITILFAKGNSHNILPFCLFLHVRYVYLSHYYILVLFLTLYLGDCVNNTITFWNFINFNL
jgi:hypothetical protein